MGDAKDQSSNLDLGVKKEVGWSRGQVFAVADLGGL